jgi:hypothetical protein
MLILQSAYNLTPEEEELAMFMMEMSDDEGDSSKDNLMTAQERADRDPKLIRGQLHDYGRNVWVAWWMSDYIVPT